MEFVSSLVDDEGHPLAPSGGHKEAQQQTWSPEAPEAQFLHLGPISGGLEEVLYTQEPRSSQTTQEGGKASHLKGKGAQFEF